MGIRVLIVRPGLEPAVEELPDGSLDSLRAALGCAWVECVSIGGGYDAWLDEEGLLDGKPQNGCGFLGTYLFCRSDGAGDLEGLSDAGVADCLAFWRANRHVRHSGVAVVAVESFDTNDALLARLAGIRAGREEHFRASVAAGSAPAAKEEPDA